MKRKMNKKPIILAAVLIAVGLIIAGCAAFLSDSYTADDAAIDAMTPASIMIMQNSQDNSLTFMPEKPADTALIFYPGGKVEYDAYIPLMSACAERGIMCILPEMPFNLAFFDADAAESIYNMYPEIKNWYIGGHSLGGSMAASYASKNPDVFKGVILLGSYSTDDISSLGVLSVLGSEDKVLNADNYEKYKSNLPEDFTEIIIEGGCHSYFGVYGMQDGDGEPTITNSEQITLTAKEIEKFTE